MYFSIGGYELLAILALGLPTAVLHLRGDRISRRMFVATLCTSIASCLTPADLLSTAVFASALLVVYTIGLRMGSSQPNAAT